MWIWIASAVIVLLVLAFYASKWYRDAVKDEHRADYPPENPLDRR